jgi:hypothetical protein
VYTGNTANTGITTGAALASALTTGQFVDIANGSTSAAILIGGGQIFDTTYSQSRVAAQVRAMRKYANGKVLIAHGNSVSRFNADGSVDSAFAESIANSTIYDLTLTSDESAIYVCGAFTSWNTSGGSVTRNYVAKLSGSTGAVDTGWSPSASGTKYNIAVSGTTVCAGGNYPEFFSTSGSVLGNSWVQYAGTPDTYSTNAGLIVRAHPATANTFIGVGGGYEITDSGGNVSYQTNKVYHFTVSGVTFNYTTTQPGSAPSYSGSSQAVAVNATHIYYAIMESNTFQYLYRWTIGTAASEAASNYQLQYLATPKFLFQRGTDSSWWAACTGNQVSPNASTALVGWTSALGTITPFNVLSFNDLGLAGIALTDGSFLLGNVYNNTNKYLDKTVITPETGATIVGPPQTSGGGSTSSSSAQSYKTNTTVRLQKLASGNLLVAQRNTPFFS